MYTCCVILCLSFRFLLFATLDRFSQTVDLCIMYLCFEECPEDRFGIQCLQVCSCENNAACDSANGTCTCTPGWTGLLCENRQFDMLHILGETHYSVRFDYCHENGVRPFLCLKIYGPSKTIGAAITKFGPTMGLGPSYLHF